MADLEVVYDPAKEMATIVNVDERRGWGPAMIGPDAGIILQAFIDSMPFDVSVLNEYDACQVFNGFLDGLAAGATETATPDTDSPVVESGSAGVADETVPGAEHGAPTDQPPGPAPADTDTGVEVDQGETDQVIPPHDPAFGLEPVAESHFTRETCVMCDGNGTVQISPDEPAAQCGMCKGQGSVLVSVP